MAKRSTTSGSTNAGTFLLLFVLIVLGVGLVLFLAVIIPGAIGLLAVVGGLGLFVGVHYLLWGWWLPRSRGADDPPAEPE